MHVKVRMQRVYIQVCAFAFAPGMFDRVLS